MIYTCICSNTHLKVGCWYIDCRKVFCLIEGEDAKKACVQADSKGATLGPNQGEEQEDEVNINLLPKKVRNKISNWRARNVKKAKEKAKKEAQKTKDKTNKEAWKVEKSRKSKASIPPLLLIETSIASQS